MSPLSRLLGPAPRLSVRDKIVAVTIVAALVGMLAAVAGLLTYDRSFARREMEEDLNLLARNLAYHLRTALIYDDEETARETLASVELIQHVRHAHVFDAAGDLFADFSPAGGHGHVENEEIRPDGVYFRGDRAEVYRQVRLGDRVLGTVYLDSDLSPIQTRRRAFLKAALLALLAGTLLSAVLAYRLQRRVTRPILELGAAARAVTRGRDFSLRVAPADRDEIGTLTEAFNEMLQEVQRHQEQLSRARDRAEEAASEASRQANETELANVQLKFEIAERKRLQEQLIQSQKMESIGQLAGGVAHDFNNLLTVIMGWVDLAKEEAPEDGELRESLDQIQLSAERAATLTRQLLAFARRQHMEPQVLDLNELVRNLDPLLRRVCGEAVEMRYRLDPDLHTVSVDPGQFEQVLVNLALNARDAMPQGGSLLIETGDEAPPEEEISRRRGERPEGWAMISVRDTGIGMDEEVQRRIFEPFYTTKEKGKGTGLGLAMCYGIVQQNEGHILVESAPGKGSTFRIYLPWSSSRAERERTEESVEPAPAPPEGGTILLVEDEPAVRELVAAVLSAAGYTLLQADDGRQALQLAAEHGQAVDLLISDVVMPRMGGVELAQQLRRRYPGLRVLLTSGYAEEAMDERGLLIEEAEFLGKPFTPAQLLRRVREILLP